MKKPWLIISALLLVFLGWRWYFPPEPPPIDVRAAAGNKDNSTRVLLDSMDRVSSFPPVAVYQPIADRPLFFNQRRPPPPYVPSAMNPVSPRQPIRKVGKPRMQLSAIIIIGKQKYALLKGGLKKGSRRVRVGQEIDGWKVTKIESDKLALSNAGETVELLLRNYKPVIPVKHSGKKPAKKKNVKKNNKNPKAASLKGG
jgi:hypothetical protein